VLYIIVLEYTACLFKSTRAEQLPTSAEPTQSRKKQQRSFDRSGDIMSVCATVLCVCVVRCVRPFMLPVIISFSQQEHFDR
jgi:hypothetical protein